MLVVEKKQQRTVRVFKIFRKQMKRYGKFVSFPKNTDPTKTYSWRYLTKFIDDFDTIGLDDGELPSVIEAVVQDAKKRGLLRCGISILNKVDLLAVCHNKFERDVNDENH